jgi:hypothetical protein
MANIFWKNEKTDKDEAIELMKIFMVDWTENRFAVRQEGDDSGTYLCVYVERNEDGSEPCKMIPQKFEGWRTVLVFTPHEYIKCVLEVKK